MTPTGYRTPMAPADYLSLVAEREKVEVAIFSAHLRDLLDDSARAKLRRAISRLMDRAAYDAVTYPEAVVELSKLSARLDRIVAKAN